MQSVPFPVTVAVVTAISIETVSITNGSHSPTIHSFKSRKIQNVYTVKLVLYVKKLSHNICTSYEHTSAVESISNISIINPRRACAARVTVLGLCVCLLLNISLFM